jgi:hypothetical protein
VNVNCVKYCDCYSVLTWAHVDADDARFVELVVLRILSGM